PRARAGRPAPGVAGGRRRAVPGSAGGAGTGRPALPAGRGPAAAGRVHAAAEGLHTDGPGGHRPGRRGRGQTVTTGLHTPASALADQLLAQAQKEALAPKRAAQLLNLLISLPFEALKQLRQRYGLAGAGVSPEAVLAVYRRLAADPAAAVQE